MKKARKLLSLVLLCALTLLMTACGGGQTFKHGTIGGSSYTSDFLGIKATFGSEWELFTDSQTAKYNNMSDMSESSVKAQLSKTGTLFDMVAAKPDGTSVNITVSDTSKTGKIKEGEEYFTTAVELAKRTFEAQGAKVSLKADSVSFLGKSTRCIKGQMTNGGVTLHIVQIPIFKGDYIANISFGAANEADLFALLGMFKAV